MKRKQDNYSKACANTLTWNECVRSRPSLYVGNIGSDILPCDGIYVLIKEIINNSIDEITYGYGDIIEVLVDEKQIRIRDYGRGIPFDKLAEVVSKITTGIKYDSNTFQKSIGLNGVGLKVVNALSSQFYLQSFRNFCFKKVECNNGKIVAESIIKHTKEKDGTLIQFTADESIFGIYNYNLDYIEKILRYYVYLNSKLTILFNGKKIFAINGLADLLNDNMCITDRYPIIHLKSSQIEIAICHQSLPTERYYSFVNGHNTISGGTHVAAFRKAFVRVICDFFQKEFNPKDVQNSIAAAISIRIQNPVFETQQFNKLTSKSVGTEKLSMVKFINRFLENELTSYLTNHPDYANAIYSYLIESTRNQINNRH